MCRELATEKGATCFLIVSVLLATVHGARDGERDCMGKMHRRCGNALLRIHRDGEILRPEHQTQVVNHSQAFALIDPIIEALHGKPIFLCCFLVCSVTVYLCMALCFYLRRRASATSSGHDATQSDRVPGPLRLAADADADPDSAAGQLSRLKVQKLQMLVEQVMHSRKIQKIDESIWECQSEIREATKPTVEEIQRRTSEAMQTTSYAAENGILSAMAYIGPVLMQSQRIYAALERRTQAAQQRVQKLVQEESRNFGGDLMDIFSIDAPSGSPLDFMDKMDVTLLVASAFAPAQTRTLHLANTLRVLQLTVSSSLTISVLLWDRNLSCKTRWDGMVSEELYTWFVVDASISGSCLVVRLWMLQVVGRLLEDLDRVPLMQGADDPIQALCVLLDYYMTTGCEALARLDRVMSSVLYVLADWTVVFNYVWMIYATHIVFNTPWQGCPTLGIIVLRVRVLVFLCLLLPALMNIVMFVLVRFLGTDRFQLSLIGTAEAVDEILDLGVPLTEMAAQALLVRSTRGVAHLQRRKHELRRKLLLGKQQEAEAKLQELQRQRTATEAEVRRLREEREWLRREAAAEASQADEQRREQQSRAKAVVLANAEQAFSELSQQAHKASKSAEEEVRRWERGERFDLVLSDGRQNLDAVGGSEHSLPPSGQPQMSSMPSPTPSKTA